MPRYAFTGASGRIFMDLSHGVAGTAVQPADVDGKPGPTPPIGSTVLLESGDHLVTAEPYEHPELSEVDDTQPAANPKRTRIETPIPTQAAPVD